MSGISRVLETNSEWSLLGRIAAFETIGVAAVIWNPNSYYAFGFFIAMQGLVLASARSFRLINPYYSHAADLIGCHLQFLYNSKRLWNYAESKGIETDPKAREELEKEIQLFTEGLKKVREISDNRC